MDSAYSDYLSKGHYPLAVVNIFIDPGSVDFNVHPAKREINFTDSSSVYEAIFKTVK